MKHGGGRRQRRWARRKLWTTLYPHCFERQSAVTHKNLLKTALIQSFGKAGVEEVREAVMQRPEILQREFKGQRYVTTEDVLKEEQDIVDFVRAGQGHAQQAGRR